MQPVQSADAPQITLDSTCVWFEDANILTIRPPVWPPTGAKMHIGEDNYEVTGTEQSGALIWIFVKGISA
jgi:hypothetical protein